VLVVAFRRRQNVFAVIATVAALSFAINALGIRSHPVATFFLPFSRLWELLLGAMLAHVALFRPDAAIPPGQASVSSAAGLSLIAVAAAVLGEGQHFPGWWALLPTVGAALVIAAGPQAWVNRALLSRRFMVFIGLISYPLYLWHWPLLSFARHAQPGALSVALTLSLVAAAIGLSWLTYRFVERPLRFPASGRLPVRAGALATAMAVLAAAGVVVASGSIKTRLDEKFRFLSSYEYNYRSEYRGLRCHIGTQQRPRDYLPECVDEGFGDGAHLSILLWGDSFAAHLYPGLRQLAEARRVALAQYTADTCLPLLEGPTEFCQSLGPFVLDRVEHLAPDVVILASSWKHPGLEGLPGTVAALRERGASHVIVVGPVPQWQQVLPKALIQFMQEYPLAPMPHRMRYAMDPAPFALEANVKKHLAGVDAAYVSPLEVLCNEGGCLTEDDGTPLAWDKGHLTDAGSRVVARAVLDKAAALESAGPAAPRQVLRQ
jgi:hypothetical protein